MVQQNLSPTTRLVMSLSDVSMILLIDEGPLAV